MWCNRFAQSISSFSCAYGCLKGIAWPQAAGNDDLICEWLWGYFCDAGENS